MSTVLSRRTLLMASAGGLVGATSSLQAAARSDSDTVPPVPLFVRVVTVDGSAVVNAAVVDDAITQAVGIFGEHGLSFVEARPRATIDPAFADVITRDDRDRFAALVLPGMVNVFVVRKLEDVDEPGRVRMGVAWRCLRDLEKKYVLVASYARAKVMAHELGHFLGNPHSKVKNNLMSYEHEEGARVFLDAAQARVAKATARQLFASKKLKL